ncbi:MAG: hypothetical protein OIF51_06690 [Cellvibrionaceae bacterium]|nr:hypothetical protein [Cellvibrionaceae bacterium]
MTNSPGGNLGLVPLKTMDGFHPWVYGAFSKHSPKLFRLEGT